MIKNIKLSLLEPNKGQIDGLPKNPRFIKDNKFEKLVQSIKENPEMLELRELLVYPHEGKYVIIGGNMRYRAMQELGYKETFCKVIPESATIEQLKAYTIKDNNGFGEWDMDLLANEWDFSELEDWGVDLPNVESGYSIDDVETSDSFSLKSGDKEPFQKMSFVLADEQAELLKISINAVKQTQEYKYMETFGNTNTNGNALYLIVQQWVDARK